MKNKRGASDLLYGPVIFFIANIIFFSIVGLGVTISIGDSDVLKEEALAKQVALLIDGSYKGTKIEVDTSELIVTARDNKIEPTIYLSCNTNEVFVKATRSGGYSFKYFNDLEECNFLFDEEKRKFIVNV